MNLKEIAAEVLEEDTSPVKATENADGSVSYTVVVKFDPKVQAEKAKAMPKGMKREDQADDLTDTEDAAPPPRGIFSAALDEIVASLAPVEDASKHANTPLENCRAKDPMYCPYHGDKAIKNAVTDSLKKMGVSTFSVEVSSKGKGMFGITVITPIPDPKVTPAIWDAFNDSQGKLKKGVSFGASQGDKVTVKTVKIESDANPDRDTAMIDEWIDDLVQDISADKTLMQDLDPQDVRDLLGARQDIDSHEDDAEAKKSAIANVRGLYHGLRAQIDYRDIKTSDDADNKEGAIEEAMVKNGEEYHSVRAPVDAVKAALFANKKFPNGFAKSHPWVEEYNKASQRVGYWGQKMYDDAKEKANENAPTDMKGRRTSISEMDYARERYEDDLKSLKEAVPKFLTEFKKWAEAEVAAGKKTQEQFDTAFPDN